MIAAKHSVLLGYGLKIFFDFVIWPPVCSDAFTYICDPA